MTATSEKPLYAIALASAVVSTVFWLIFIATSGSAPLPPFSDAEARYAAIVSSERVVLSYGWSGTLGAFLTIPYLLAIVYSLRDRGPHMWLVFVAGTIGAFLTAAAFMGVSLSAVYFAVASVDPAGPELQANLAAFQIASDMFEAGWFIGSFLCYGLAIAWASWEALREACGPKWLNWLGLIGGFAGVVWLRPFIRVLLPLELIGSVANVVLLSIWAVGLTWVLWRSSATS